MSKIRNFKEIIQLQEAKRPQLDSIPDVLSQNPTKEQIDINANNEVIDDNVNNEDNEGNKILNEVIVDVPSNIKSSKPKKPNADFKINNFIKLLSEKEDRKKNKAVQGFLPRDEYASFIRVMGKIKTLAALKDSDTRTSSTTLIRLMIAESLNKIEKALDIETASEENK